MPHITVCICTYRRGELLKRLLANLERQETGGYFGYSIVVCDNDNLLSSKPIVSEFAASSKLPVIYCTEPRQNIALARNQALKFAKGEFVAFIDDDEFPASKWLGIMLETCEHFRATGVLGPVRPHFEQPPPRWILTGRFCERPEYETGRRMSGGECRTGNVLMRRSALDGMAEPFRPEFGTGGEDTDFFMRSIKAGSLFVWCNEGLTFETVPQNRWTRRYMLKRALLRGKITLINPKRPIRLIATSFLAVFAYGCILLPALLLGQHVFMKYCIRFCDHAGRLLELVHLNPLKTRT